MKIDISSLIGSLVDATVKSLNEAPKKPDSKTRIKKGKGTVSYKTAISYTDDERNEDPSKKAAYDAAVDLRDNPPEDDETPTQLEET